MTVMRHEYKIVTGSESVLKQYVRAPEYAACLYEITKEFRERQKYGDEKATTWEEAYQTLWDILEGFNIDPFSED